MPEREISEEEVQAVRDWVLDKKGSGTLLSNEKMVEEILKSNRSYFPYEGGITFVVDKEPLVIASRRSHWNPNTDRYELGFRLICSEKHAKELEEAGIVSFQEVQETAK